MKIKDGNLKFERWKFILKFKVFRKIHTRLLVVSVGFCLRGWGRGIEIYQSGGVGVRVVRVRVGWCYFL